MGICIGPVVSGSVENTRSHGMSSTVYRAESCKVPLQVSILRSVPQRFCSEMGPRNLHFEDELQAIVISLAY